MTHKACDYDYSGSKDMLDEQFVFYLESLKVDLDEALISHRWSQFREHLDAFSQLVSSFEYRNYDNSSEYIEKSTLCEGWEELEKKWNKIESDPDISFSNDSEMAIEELQYMVNKTKYWEDQEFTDIKIIFGYSP
jgi:hypothetical protein